MARKQITVDELDAAKARADRAYSLFTAAREQLDQANGQYEALIARHEAEIAVAQSRISTARAEIDRNSRVSGRLADLTA